MDARHIYGLLVFTLLVASTIFLAGFVVFQWVRGGSKRRRLASVAGLYALLFVVLCLSYLPIGRLDATLVAATAQALVAGVVLGVFVGGVFSVARGIIRWHRRLRAYEEEPRLAEERQSQLTEATDQSRGQVCSEEGERPSRSIRHDVRNAVLALGAPLYLGREIWHRRRLRAEERRLAEEQRLAEERRLAEEQRLAEEAERQRQEKIRLHEEAERRRHVIDTIRRAKERNRRRAKESSHRAADEEQRKHIESLLRRDAVRDEINYMSGVQFERFVADVLRQKGYAVEETKATGDQGVDLLLPDLDGKRVAVQLKRYTGPVGNSAVQATFAGMGYYQAEEGWVITTSTFTRSARELARSLGVRLIDGKELADWLESLKEE